MDNTLKELLAGILIFAAACQVIPVWLVNDRAGYSMGLWIGTLMAAGSAYHMWRTLDRSLQYGEEHARRQVSKSSLLRYAVIVLVFALLMMPGPVNPLAAFLGLMGLKAGAYIQPVIHKFKESRR